MKISLKYRYLTQCLSAALGMGLMMTAQPVMAELPASVSGLAVPSLAPMLKPIMPAVVNITTQGRIAAPTDPFSEPADQRGTPSKRGKSFESIGSGVIVDAKKGYILTNAHLTDQAQIITVTLSDGGRYRAKLVGQDVASDIAVLQINAPKLTAISMADSNKLEVGDFVVAIGNPYGLSQTVTSGVVSALQRNNLGIEGYENFIQTDASINPGNSGGALVDLKGQLVGINTAILAPDGGNIGIGFAIPIDMAENIMTQLIKYGSLGRGVAGIMMQTVTPELATAFQASNSQGAVITQVLADSPAAKAGLQVGDIITTINDSPIQNAGQVRNAIGLLRSGSKVNLTVERKGQSVKLSLVTADPKQYEQATQASNPYFNGVIMRNFDAQVPNFGYVQGVQVLHLEDTTQAWQAGLRPDDVIISVNQQATKDLVDLWQIANQQKGDLLVNVYRDGGASFFVIHRG